MRRQIVVLAIIVCSSAACERPTAPAGSLPDTPDITSLVVGDAAAALDSRGEFRLTESSSPNGDTIISSSRAGELASAYVRTDWERLIPQLAQEHGSAIDMNTLVPSSRVYYAQTPYGPFPSGFHPAMKRLYGPSYLVSFTSGGRSVIAVAVSALATDYGMASHGDLVEPLLAGNALYAAGISEDTRAYQVLTPEQAVYVAATSTHAKASALPELCLRGRLYQPLLAFWRVRLDHSVNVQVASSGRSIATNVLYVGYDDAHRMMVASASQPPSEHGNGSKVSASYEYLGEFPFDVAIRAGAAVQFDSVIPDSR